MAVVKGPFMSVDARGSAGGLTASFVKGGIVMKSKANPATKYEPNLNRTRSILGWLSRRWGELTDGQRDAWGAWAIDHPGTDKFGDPFIMSGFNAFIMLNHNAVRLQHGLAQKALPPEDPPAAAINGLDCTIGVGNPGEIDCAWSQNGMGLANDYWEIHAAGPFQSKGRKSVISRFKWVAQVAGNVLLETLTGLCEGMWYWIRVRYVAEDGQITAWMAVQQTPMLTP